MEENQVVEQKEITFGRIIKVAFRNWKLFTPIALVVAAGCALGIHFGYNTMKGSYSSTFSYSSVDLSQEKYADGSSFYYRNLVSSSNLNKIKASNEKYASIDIDKILDSNGISVSKDEEKKTYTIKLSYKFIKNGDVAKSFIKDIAESPLKQDADIVTNTSFDSALKSFDNAETFEEQIKYLVRQADFLASSYDAITKSANLPLSVNELATNNKEKVNILIDSNYSKNMNYRISSNGYVKSYEAQEAKNYEVTSSLLVEEKNLNTAKIDALEDEINNISSTATTAISTLSQQMESLILRNQDIQYEVDAIARKLANKGKSEAEIPGYTAFKDDLASDRSKLATYTNDYKDVLKSAYVDTAEVTYENSSITTLNGTISLLINGAISVVVGVVVGAVVNLIVDRKKLYE